MSKPKETKDEQAADARNAIGGQGVAGATESPAAPKETMTSEELASSTHPKAPELPLEAPKGDPVADAVDNSDPAPEGEKPPTDAVETEQPTK